MNILAKTLAGSGLALSIAASSAQAAILGAGTYLNHVNLSTAEQAVPLRQNNATALPFDTKVDNAFVVVTYSANCAVHGEAGGYISIRIEVDGIATLPQAGYDFALCTTLADSENLPSLRTSRQAVIKVPQAGLHYVQVFGSLQYANLGILSDSSIVVHD